MNSHSFQAKSGVFMSAQDRLELPHPSTAMFQRFSQEQARWLFCLQVGRKQKKSYLNKYVNVNDIYYI
jgi:hypothetical protein